MSAATLFESGKFAAGGSAGRRGTLVSLLTGGFGAAQEVPRVQRISHHANGQLAMRHYLRGLEQMVQRCEHAQISATLVQVTPKEIQALVEKTAKAKARYLAAALELAEGEPLPEVSQVKTLEQARERHEAMQAGLEAILGELKRGNIEVAGVAPDLGDDPEAE